MRARGAAVVGGAAREDAGARGEPSSVVREAVVTQQHGPIPAQPFELAGRELELGAHAVPRRVGVVMTMRVVEEDAARCDGGAESGEQPSIQKIHHEHERVVRGRQRPSRDVRGDARDSEAVSAGPIVQGSERRRRVVDRVDSVAMLREQQRVSSATACDVERASGPGSGQRIESLQCAYDERRGGIDGRVGAAAVVPSMAAVPVVLHGASLYHAREG